MLKNVMDKDGKNIQIDSVSCPDWPLKYRHHITGEKFELTAKERKEVDEALDAKAKADAKAEADKKAEADAKAEADKKAKADAKAKAKTDTEAKK